MDAVRALIFVGFGTFAGLVHAQVTEIFKSVDPTGQKR